MERMREDYLSRQSSLCRPTVFLVGFGSCAEREQLPRVFAGHGYSLIKEERGEKERREKGSKRGEIERKKEKKKIKL